MAVTDDTGSPRADLGLSNQASPGTAESYREPLSHWLATRWPDRAIIRLDSFASPSEGLSNETVLFDATFDEGGVLKTERLVTRIQAHGTPLAPLQTTRCASSVEFEYHLQSAVAGQPGCAAAPVVGFESDESFVGRPFYVMRCIEGRVPGVNPSFHLEGFMKDEASPTQRRHVAEATIAAMARVHSVSWRTTGLSSLFPDSSPDLAYQRDLYARDFETQLGERSFPLVARALSWLTSTDPGAHRIGIVWGDARLGNVIVNENYEPAALLDWENGFVGPCEADVGWWMVSERVNHDVLAIPRLAGYPTYNDQVGMYEKASGGAIEHLRYWEVFAALRMAHGVLRLADRMEEAGALPAEMASLGFENPITMVLEQLLSAS